MATVTSHDTTSGTTSEPIRPADEIRADLARKKTHLQRAWAQLLQPNRDGILGGRRRDNRGPALAMILRLEQKKRELQDELFKARCFEAWLEGMWNQLGGEVDEAGAYR